jgi:hypothetical protein
LDCEVVAVKEHHMLIYRPTLLMMDEIAPEMSS